MYPKRRLVQNLGVPEEIVKRPKKAAQYGSGIHKMLKKVLKEEKYRDLPNKFRFECKLIKYNQ